MADEEPTGVDWKRRVLGSTCSADRECSAHGAVRYACSVSRVVEFMGVQYFGGGETMEIVELYIGDMNLSSPRDQVDVMFVVLDTVLGFAP